MKSAVLLAALFVFPAAIFPAITGCGLIDLNDLDDDDDDDDIDVDGCKDACDAQEFFCENAAVHSACRDACEEADDDAVETFKACVEADASNCGCALDVGEGEGEGEGTGEG